MKIIQLVYSLCSGGAERFVVSLSNCLVEAGHEVEVCILLDDAIEGLAFNKPLLKPEVRFHSMKFSAGFSLSKKRKVEKYIESQHPDVVHCHMNVIPYIFSLALKDRSIRFVHTLHSVAENASGSKYQYGLNKFFYKKQYIQPVTISKKCQESYINFYHLNNAPYIDNGCATVEPSPNYNKVCVEMEGLKQGKDIPVFIHVARYNKLKNQDMLIDAFNALSEEGSEFVLLVIGRGFDTEEASELRNRACKSIHFLGEKNNVGDYLLNADAFCLTSVFEGLPISMLEAISAGVTPICTPVGGILDVIEDGVTGYLSEDGSLPSYLAAVHRFLKCKLDPETLKKHFEIHFSMQACADKYVELYKLEK